ncbi:hypothetical protein [Qipengyuania sp. NPDC077563]|uniref:hypothetical protein n=1 Tax=Qipengyuania sp. NPDC077563 TaxID=3364497 RepID=UPI00384EE6BA
MHEIDDFDWEFANFQPHEATKRFRKFSSVFDSETLRGKILVTMGFLEDLLARGIKEFLVETNHGVFQGFARRSLGSLSAKQHLAYLLGIISEEEFEIIERMAKIRNLFAHDPMISGADEKIRNHTRDLAKLLNLDQYKESESSNCVEETWGMTHWALLVPLMNRPERASEYRLRTREWELSAP